MSMSREEAIEFLMEHYQHPYHKGHLEDADISLSGGSPGCSDVVTMQATFDEDGKLKEVYFEGEGCTVSMAAASYVSEITEGKTPDEIEAMTFEDLIDALGREVVMTRPTCATTALGTLKKGVHEYRRKKQAER
ncbi:MAG TPA: iron-sulfur cluster assembly scaffold protein [Ktedonobacterales bacterium]